MDLRSPTALSSGTLTLQAYRNVFREFSSKVEKFIIQVLPNQVFK